MKTTSALLVGCSIVGSFLIGMAFERANGPSRPANVDDPAEMREALRGAFVEPHPAMRMRLMRQLIDAVDEENLPGAIEAYRAFSSTAETLGVSDFFARWAELDVEGLEKAMLDWPDEKSRAQGIGWVVYEYAERDGIARAITYYDDLSGAIKLYTGYRLIEGAANHGELDDLLEWVAAHDDRAERNRLTQSVVLKVLRERGSEGVESLFDSVDRDAPNRFKRQLFLITLEKLTRDDPAIALPFLAKHEDEPFAENGALRMVIAWVDVDPPGVLAWIESRPPGPERDRLFEAVIDRWAALDETSAIDWTRTRPPSPMIDRLRSKFVALTTIRDPGLAVELAGNMVDDEMRRSALRGFARYWFNRRPEDTSAWLVKAGLTEADAAGVIDELSQARAIRLPRTRRRGAENS